MGMWARSPGLDLLRMHRAQDVQPGITYSKGILAQARGSRSISLAGCDVYWLSGMASIPGYADFSVFCTVHRAKQDLYRVVQLDHRLRVKGWDWVSRLYELKV